MKNGAVMCYETCAMNLFAVDGITISCTAMSGWIVAAPMMGRLG